MGRTELPWLLWGRHVRPYALAASVGTAVLCALLVTGTSVWTHKARWDGYTLSMAVVAALSTVLLWAGFWRSSAALMQHGLMLTTFLFTIRGAYIAIAGGFTLSAWLTAGISFSWALASAGAWLLESTTGRGGPMGPDPGRRREMT